MRTYVMVFEGEAADPGKRIEFTGLDPSPALEIARREAHGATIALFEGTKRLGTLKRLGPELWHLS